jgi:hypothetical protein
VHGPRRLADDHQVVDVQAHGQPADGVVLGLGGVPELAHLAEDGHRAGRPPTAADGGERLEGGPHRVGVRVVGVVDDDHAVGPLADLHPAT